MQLGRPSRPQGWKDTGHRQCHHCTTPRTRASRIEDFSDLRNLGPEVRAERCGNRSAMGPECADPG